MVCWCATGLLGLVIAVTGYLFVKRNRKGSSELVVKNWKPGVVYVIRVILFLLYQVCIVI